MSQRTVALFFVVFASLAMACHPGATAPAPEATAGGTSASDILHFAQAPGARCALMNVADPKCTPGAALPNVTVSEICTSGYSSRVRDVPETVKEQVYQEYGVTSHPPGAYEIDHLISLELGGSNDASNLWPEAAQPKPGFHEKDAVENYLHDQVCAGRISLQEAQHNIATNWLGVYRALHVRP